MHEASLMRSLMRKIDSLANAEGATRVTTVRVWLGALSHMSARHFQEHFEQASRATLADGASLEIEESTDIDDPNAQDLLLRSIEVET
ncbi:MAG TPA: hydrogenase maturation nickel metallochaperone HypA [Burkholderiales bacterium]|nr:hydrogenase maturation nickel metallochaperone HypA [Burkholderiales bacterium]